MNSPLQLSVYNSFSEDGRKSEKTLSWVLIFSETHFIETNFSPNPTLTKCREANNEVEVLVIHRNRSVLQVDF